MSRVLCSLSMLALVAAPHAGGTPFQDGFGGSLTVRASVASDGSEGDFASAQPSITDDGRFVAFHSAATNLVDGDNNGDLDIFVRDRISNTTARVSVASDGSEGNGDSSRPAFSADGRFVAFVSSATDLVPGDTNGFADVFVHDRDTGNTERVSVASDGSEGNGNSTRPAISADGRFVAFESDANDLVVGDTNARRDIFVHDRQSDTTERVSIATNGMEGNDDSVRAAISANGRVIAFESDASDLVSGDNNNDSDVFVHDREGDGAPDTTVRVSVTSGGAEANGDSFRPSLSADGRFVAFSSSAALVTDDTNNGRDAFVHDRASGITERVSVRSDGSEAGGGVNIGGGGLFAAISSDGRFVAFDSLANNLVDGDTNNVDDVFVHDRDTGLTERVSVASDGTQGNQRSGSGSLDINANGRFVAFESVASALVDGDNNGAGDVFVRVGSSLRFFLARRNAFPLPLARDRQ